MIRDDEGHLVAARAGKEANVPDASYMELLGRRSS